MMMATEDNGGDMEANEPPLETETPLQEEAAVQGEMVMEEAEDSKPSIEEVQVLLEDSRAKADEHWNQLLRANAEMENLRKRNKRELEQAHKFALDRIAEELLPVRDSLELGLSAAAEADADVEKLREGTELTLKQLANLMDKFAIQAIDPSGEKFDPQLHQAMSIQEVADTETNTVLTVFQKGYTLNGRLIRPARVIVSK